MESLEKLLYDWNAREDTRPTLKSSIERSLRIGEIVPAWRVLRKASDDVAEEFEVKVLEVLKELIRLQPIRMDRVFADQRSYYYLRAEWETDLMPFTGLVLTLAYVTDRDRTLEGYAKFDQIRPYHHHRAATSLDSRMLRLQDVTNARVQLWLDDVLLSESLWKADGPKVFPHEESNVIVGPDLLDEMESLGVGVRAAKTRWKVGRYPPAK